jgi:two-component system OmpR family response regulator
MSVPSATLLVVEDDPEISRLVGEFMRREGFDIALAESGQEMDAVLQRLRPDLIILDLMLPGEDGLSICRRLRATDSIPILMLTAKSDEVDRVVGLEMGADDYLAKPFGPRELLARVRAILRRAQTAPVAPVSRRFAFDRFILDADARLVECFREEGGDVFRLIGGRRQRLARLLFATLPDPRFARASRTVTDYERLAYRTRASAIGMQQSECGHAAGA